MLLSEPFWSLCVFFNLNIVCDLHPHPFCEYLIVLLFISFKNMNFEKLWRIFREQMNKKMEGGGGGGGGGGGQGGGRGCLWVIA